MTYFYNTKQLHNNTSTMFDFTKVKNIMLNNSSHTLFITVHKLYKGYITKYTCDVLKNNKYYIYPYHHNVILIQFRDYDNNIKNLLWSPITDSVFNQLNTNLNNVLKDINCKPSDIDYIGYNYISNYYIKEKEILNIMDIFPNAKLLVQNLDIKNSSTLRSLYNRIITYDGNMSLGPSLYIFYIPQINTYHQSLFCSYDDHILSITGNINSIDQLSSINSNSENLDFLLTTSNPYDINHSFIIPIDELDSSIFSKNIKLIKSNLPETYVTFTYGRFKYVRFFIG